ncbi:MAG: hypothetical protein NT169_04405 [Chloroflexi bacterium]|nr:hypothetical protein [Chloroflexota bacterium]
MQKDPIVAEVRKIREDYAAQCNFDLQALYRALKEREQQDPRPKVSYPAKPAKIAPRRKSGAMRNVPRTGKELLLRETTAWETASEEDALKTEKRLAEMK